MKDTERLPVLDDLIGDGRPKHMRARAYRALIDERKELVDRLGDKRPVAPVHLRYVLKPQWITLPSPSGESAVPAGTSRLAIGPPLPDVVEIIGPTLFGGRSFAQLIEHAIERDVVPCYQRLVARSSRVSPLQLRRAFKGAEIGEVPILEAAGAAVVQDQHAEELQATVRVEFEGDPTFFAIGLAGRKQPRMPRAGVQGSHIVLCVRYTPGNALFATALLQDERDLIERCFDQQRARATHVLQLSPPP